MGSDVVLTAALRNNLLSLQNTQRNIDTTQLRLATGLKVNSALDNPQNFFTAQSLNNRATDLGRLLDGINQSIRTIEEANTGVNALSDLINQAESVALEAQAELRAAEGFARIRGSVDLSGVSDLTTLGGGGVITTAGTTANAFDVVFSNYNAENDTVSTATFNIVIAANETVDNIVADINSAVANNSLVRASVTNGGQLAIESLVDGAQIRIEEAAANPLTSAGFALLGLDNVVSTEDVAGGATQQGGTAIAGNVIESARSGAATVNGAYEASATLTAAGFLGATTESAAITLTIDGEQTALNGGVEITGAETIQDVVDAVNNAGLADVTASFNTSTGQIELEFADTVGSVEIQFDSAAAGATLGFGFGTGEAGTRTGGGTVAIAAGETASEQLTLVGTSANLDQFEADYNEIRSQIDNIVEDANYRGINLLSDDNLTTFFNEDRDNTLLTEGVDFSALGLGLSEADFTTSNTIQLSVDTARSALEDVRNFGQSIANDLSIIQIRRDFTEETINTLQAGADDLTVADQNEEGANLLALQTRQQLGVTSLSLAAQSQQSVLRLF